MTQPTSTRPPRALVAEDEPLLRMALCADLLRAWPDLQIVHQATHGEDALRQALTLQPDLLFLDIRMPGMTGLEVADALQEDWPADVPMPLVSFVTAYADHALEAFQQGAVDYITKPWTPERLGQSLRQMKQRWSERCAWMATGGDDHAPQLAEPAWVGQLAAMLHGRAASAPATAPAATERWRHLPVAVGSKTFMVDLDEVHWFEAADKHLKIVTATQVYWVRLSLKELQPHLDPDAFWNIHRSYIVAAKAVHSAERDEAGRMQLRLKDRNDLLPVSRAQQGRFKGY